MSSEQDIRESKQAEILINNDIFIKAVSALKEEYVNKWLSSTDPGDHELRESLHKAIRILPEVERHLRIIVEKGKITNSQMNKLSGIIK